MSRNRIFLLVGIVCLILMTQHFGGLGGSRNKDKQSLREMLGTFTNPSGKTGNFISLELIPNPIKTDSAMGTIQARKGAGHLHELLGYSDLDFIWGYNEWDPKLIISILPARDPNRDINLSKLSPDKLPAQGRLMLTALGHTILQVRTLPLGNMEGRARQLFTNQKDLTLTRTKEPLYSPPNF